MSTIRHPYWTEYWTKGHAPAILLWEVLVHSLPCSGYASPALGFGVNKEAVQLLKYKLQ